MNKWIRIKFDALREEFGGKCFWPYCNKTEGVHFAHIKPTGLSGWNRGRKERYYDIIRNRDCYRLYCKVHHRMHDKEEAPECYAEDPCPYSRECLKCRWLWPCVAIYVYRLTQAQH